jgi:hypothetical protein
VYAGPLRLRGRAGEMMGSLVRGNKVLGVDISRIYSRSSIDREWMAVANAERSSLTRIAGTEGGILP